MKTSHVAGQPSGAPSAAQLKEFFAQIESGRITKSKLQLFLRGDVHATTSYELARVLLGKNFFGPSEWSTFYGVNFSKNQLEEIPRFPWDEDVLNAPCPFVKEKLVKETHFAFLGLDVLNGKPLNILRWQSLHPTSGRPRFSTYAPHSWYAQETFASQPCVFRWYLLLTSIIPNSTSRTHEEQLKMLPADYEIPTAIAEVSKNVLVYRKVRFCANSNRRAHCQATSDVFRVVVSYLPWSGPGDEDGIGIGPWKGLPDPNVGVGASRKLP